MEENKGADVGKDPMSVFYETIGQIISSWSYIEEQLGFMFLALLQTKQTNAALAAFYAPVAFEVKLSMVLAAAPYAMPQEFNDEWIAIAARLEKKAKIRNHIAHFQIVHEMQGPLPVSPGTGPSKPVLQPIVSNTKAYLNKTETKYYQHDLNTVRNGFMELLSDLSLFRIRVLQKLSPKSTAT